MTNLTLVENKTNETEDDDSWAQITNGKLVKFDNSRCRKLAAAFDSGNREPGNEVAKLCVLLLDKVSSEAGNLLVQSGLADEGDDILDVLAQAIEEFSIVRDELQEMREEIAQEVFAAGIANEH